MSFADSYLGGLRALVGSRPLIAAGVRVLIQDDAGRFLCIRRADSGDWGLPGGALELGESLLDAIHREAREEASATLREVTPFGLSSDPVVERHTYPNGDIIQNVSLLAHARLEGGSHGPNDGEALETRFFAEEAIDPSQFVKTEYPSFAHYRRFRETGQFQLV